MCSFSLFPAGQQPLSRFRTAGKTVLYSAFEERPKHLDPARSYSENEYVYLGNIYEPPLQYHYLKRPYQLEPQTAAAMPTVRYFDAAGRALPADAEPGKIAVSEYEIRIKPGTRYQPHPASPRTRRVSRAMCPSIRRNWRASIHSRISPRPAAGS
jgi:hypothetical protein